MKPQRRWCIWHPEDGALHWTCSYSDESLRDYKRRWASRDNHISALRIVRVEIHVVDRKHRIPKYRR